MYGAFDHSVTISNLLVPGKEPDASAGNILSEGYQIASKGSVLLFISEKIYNLDELRLSLNFPSGNAADLVSELIHREGVMGCRRLNGKSTIILRENENTTIIRDRNGEGPMVYFTKDFFTDSYQGLFRFKNFKAEPDLTGITTFMKIGYIPAPVTSLAGVSKVPAGEILFATKAGFRFEKLFDFDEILHADRKEIPLPEAIETYSDLLKKSLNRRIGDVDTVGVLLSGGYDSGGNIAMTRDIYPGKIKTYSIGFKDNPASELLYARMMAEQYGAEHHEYVMDGTEIEFLPDIIDALGDPFSESGFMLNHSVMKMVSTENLPVTIGGDGNDQYFGAGIRETALHYKMRRYGLAPFSNMFDKLSSNNFFDKDNLAFRVRYQNQKILKVMEPETFGFPDFQLNQMFLLKDIAPHRFLAAIPDKFNSYEELFLQRNYYLHLQHSVNEVILFKASRMSEFFDVNLAFSYIDLDIYHFIQNLPIHLRAKGTVEECMKGKGVTKFIHKQLVKTMLPSAVTNRPKQGGFSPLEIFFNTAERRKAIYRYIRNSSFAAILKKNNFLEDFFTQYEALATGQSYWFWHKQVKSNQLINLLIITLWWDRVIENRKSAGFSDNLLYLHHV
ncbi:MAG: asparagine synthase-related protein [Bacteroidota bacterium]